MYINIIVASSNLIGLYFMNHWIILMAMIASILYHLAETKHNLPGIYPFNLYTQTLLNIDRLFAVVAGLWAIYNVKDNVDIIIYNYWKSIIFSFICLFISEGDRFAFYPTNKPLYIVTHCIWHALAYYHLSICFLNN